MEADRVQKIAVLGAGVMGHGIAQVAAMNGYSVAIRDIKQEFLENAEKGIKKSLTRFQERGRITEEEVNMTLGRITFTLDLAEAVADAQLVVEAIPEKMSLKHLVWGEVSKVAPGDAILASNTSSLSITGIAEAVDNPERFIGMHFFNPPAVMKLVEVNQGLKTSAATVETVKELARQMKKTPVHVRKDAPGFIVNRVLVTYLNEAAKLLPEYSVEQIDAAMQHRAGMPIGPFMLSDLIGLDIVHDILKIFEENLGENYAPAEAITDLYNSRNLGRKTGAGFYSYEKRPSVTEQQAEGFDTLRLLEPFVAEAEKVVAEGIASEEDVDTALKLGANLPRGPFEMKAMGLGPERPVLTSSDAGVYTVTLNRPGKLNSMTNEMLEMIEEALKEAEMDASVRCIVFRGAGGRAFCAGADIQGFTTMGVEGARKVTETGHRVFKRMLTLPKPIVAAIDGYCLGGGNELSLYCDFRLASEKSRFSQPEVSLGLMPGWGGTHMLTKLVGPTLAKELAMTGRRITAGEAHQAGLLTAVYPDDVFSVKVDEYVSKLVDGSPTALASIKKLVNMDPQLEEALRAEEKAFTELWRYDDLIEGLNAFNEKRKPEFKGK